MEETSQQYFSYIIAVSFRGGLETSQQYFSYIIAVVLEVEETTSKTDSYDIAEILLTGFLQQLYITEIIVDWFPPPLKVTGYDITEIF